MVNSLRELYQYRLWCIWWLWPLLWPGAWMNNSFHTNYVKCKSGMNCFLRWFSKIEFGSCVNGHVSEPNIDLVTYYWPSPRNFGHVVFSAVARLESQWSHDAKQMGHQLRFCFVEFLFVLGLFWKSKKYRCICYSLAILKRRSCRNLSLRMTRASITYIFISMVTNDPLIKWAKSSARSPGVFGLQHERG